VPYSIGPRRGGVAFPGKYINQGIRLKCLFHLDHRGRMLEAKSPLLYGTYLSSEITVLLRELNVFPFVATR
jgi:hypothetical protein